MIRHTVAALLVGAASLAAQPPHPQPKSDRELLEGGSAVEFKEFKLILPKGWERRPNPIITLTAKPVGTKAVNPAFRLAILKLPEKYAWKDSVAASKEKWAEAKVWKIESEKATKLNGRHAHRMILTENLVVASGKQIKYFIDAGGHVFIVTGSADPNEFDRLLPLFEAMIRSLEIQLP